MATQIQKRQIATTLIDGWTPADATWTYASASTITVPSGAASIYQKGDRIKWTQTTVKYGVIVAVADTLLTIAPNDTYAVTDAAISANYYSHQAKDYLRFDRLMYFRNAHQPCWRLRVPRGKHDCKLNQYFQKHQYLHYQRRSD